MKKIVLLIAILSLYTFGNEIEEGKKLYLEAKCQKCHLQDSKFDPNSIKKEGLTSKVKSKSDIHKWVVSCNNFFGTGWFPEEEEKVAKYLNSTFYKLKK